MSDSAAESGGESFEKLRRLVRACDRFESALASGESPRIVDFLDGLPGVEKSEAIRRMERIGRDHESGGDPDATEGPGRGRPGGTTADGPGSGPATWSEEAPDPDDPTKLAEASTEPVVDGEAGRSSEWIAPGSIFGDYEILERIGRGGMGVVYRARQRKLKLNRVVALKLIRTDRISEPTLDASDVAIERFQVETQAAALLEHAHVVPIFDAGESEGRFYYSMFFVDGPGLDRVLRDGPISGRQAAGWLEPIARAVEEAHKLRIIHRDIKPSNILIDAQGKPYLTDFGLAKFLEEAEGLTISRAQLGSPPYMSPEQARDAGRAGPASDIYSLGATLYSLLTGRPPFQSADPRETMRQVVDELPVAPRRLNPAIPLDLETLCLKCLEKDPHRRFASAGELADELARFLRDEPIRTRPLAPWERTFRWFRRRPAIARLVAGIVLLSGLWMATTAWQLREARRAGAILQAKNRELEIREYRGRIALAADSIAAQRIARAEESLGRCPVELRGWEWWHLRRRCHEEPGTWQRMGEAIFGLAFSPGGGEIACGGRGPAITLLEARTGRPSGTLDAVANVRRVAWSRGPGGGDQVVAASGDGAIRIWERASGRWSPPRVIRAHTRPATDVAVSDDGRRVVSSGEDGRIVVWDAATGNPLVTLHESREGVQAIALGAGGRKLVATGDDGVVRLWEDLADPTPVVLGRLTDIGLAVAFSRDGRTAAAADADGSVSTWDLAERGRSRTFKGHLDGVNALAIPGDGSRLASAGADGLVKLWDLTPGPEGECLTLREHVEKSAVVEGVAFSPDGSLLASAGADGTLVVRDRSPWSRPLPPPPVELSGHVKPVVALEVRRDGKQIASASIDGTILLWDLPGRDRPRPILGGRDRINALAYSPDNRRLASVGRDRRVRVWRLAEVGGEPVVLGTDPGVLVAVVFLPDGRHLATAGLSREIRIWDSEGLEPSRVRGKGDNEVTALASSPDGRWLASAGAGRSISLWDLRDASAPPRTFSGHGQEVNGLAFSPGGERLYSVSHDWTAIAWDVATGRRAATLRGHTGRVWGVAAAPIGGLLATAGSDGTVRVWNPEEGRELANLAGHDGRVYAVAFDPLGRFLASAGKDARIRLWPSSRWEEAGSGGAGADGISR